MRLRVSPDDEDAFNEARDALLDAFAGWLDRPESESAELVGDAGLFLDWRHGYSTGVLDEFTEDDITEFLLEWCPRKVSMPADVATDICLAVGAYVEFMAQTGRLVGGADRAARLSALAHELAPAMRAEMDNPANFGMAKSLFAGLGDVSDLSEDDLKAALQARTDEHNALPFDQRRAVTDLFFEPDPEPESIELPFVFIPPPDSDVEASAAEAPMPAKVRALREYLGPDGKPLTDKGNLKLTDGRALIELLVTGDEMDSRIGEKTFRTVSTADLPRLMFLVDVAKKAGAVRVYRRRLVPTKAWAARSMVGQARGLVGATIDLGPLQSLRSGRIWFYDELHQMLDDGIPLWLSVLLGPRPAVSFDELVELPKAVVRDQLAPYWPQDWAGDSEKLAVRDLGTILECLDLAGAVLWTDRIEVPETFGHSSWTGGTIELTALGRCVLPDFVDDAGVVLPRIDDLADADGAALIDALMSVVDTQYEAVVSAWQSDRPAVERIQLITEAITHSDTAIGRMMGFVVLDAFDVDIVEPLVRQLLDTPVAGNAAMWLIGHGRADMTSVGGFVDTAAMVDMFACSLDQPEELCAAFSNGVDPDQPFLLLEDMWRHDAPETAEVLDVLGHHLQDPKLAKAARKAVMRHRSWMANRH